MTEAKFLNLQQKRMTGSFTYYNLELPNYENMIVGGVIVESLFPIARVAVTPTEFQQILIATYGPRIPPEVIQQLQRQIRMLPDGRIEYPVDKRELKNL